ncbi:MULTISPECIES: hypothetical protein [Flavobacterium]|uniref:hypothetical protein n=1 Tax=Flavobacterium TaxID=237 RepID=UPI000272DC09|nr:MULTISPECIES: hypothetical protein [Flavobacterium]EJG02253.1 hypothetical protein FF52_06220 [Flavobacterium sp. F52]OXG00632.1 hypothetical protein B0A63_08965 [Flavobacterium johnsoniae UW101]RXM45559.1 hypothetical protein BOW57_05525 [Flavobacterium sp. YO64]WJS93540.1 hypothetical protein NYQ10_15725 [Flavobacterium johnsoniae]WQG81735.1 hypothetical protein SR927_01265 [Flavobacterium johnsoniae UW101]
MKPSFNYFIGKSTAAIYKLCIGKGNAKERLIESELEIRSALRAPVPDELMPLKNKIKHNLLYSGQGASGAAKGSIARSLLGKRNSTASKFIADIIRLHLEVEAYMKYSSRN